MMLIKKICLFFLGASLLAGCKKDLDLKPTDLIDESKAFQSIDDVQKGLNAAYSRYGAVRINDMFTAAITSDEVKFGPDNGGNGQFGYRLQYGADNTSGGDVIAGWAVIYSLIDQVNRVLPNVDEVTAATPAEESQRPIIKGQLLALRAMGHFELLNWYSKRYDPADPLGVPLMLKSQLTGKPARASVAQVLAQVEADLEAAKGMLPAVTAANYNDLVLNPISITAFQARVALYKREWQKAADLATAVISSGLKPLVAASTFATIWTDNSTNEILFRVRYETSSAVGSIFTSTNGNVIFSPSDKLTSSFTAADVRLGAYIATSGGKRYVNKFFTSSRGGRVVDVKAIRTAEMYLIRAEALAELNRVAEGAADLNLLRSKRITGYTDQTFADKNALIDAVMTERFKELAFEGFRFFDLKRRGLPLQRNASDVDSPNWIGLAADSPKFTYPIPAYELLANPNMIQNPGY